MIFISEISPRPAPVVNHAEHALVALVVSVAVAAATAALLWSFA